MMPSKNHKAALTVFLKSNGPATRKQILAMTNIPVGSLSALLQNKDFTQRKHGTWALTSAKKTKVQLEQELESANDCLAMIRGRLLVLGCRHAGDHEATPPMMYDDWITCCVGKREDELDKLRESLVHLQLAVHNLLMADDMNSFPLPSGIKHRLDKLRVVHEKLKGVSCDD